MNKKIALILLCLIVSSAQADDWLDSFKFVPKNSSVYIASTLEFPEKQEYEEPSVEVYNEAVNLNNQAIDSMNSGNYDEACGLLEQAIEKLPGKIGFRKNYLSALNGAKRYDDFLKESNIVLGIDPNDTRIVYNVGLTYFNDFKDYKKAADYFSYALSINPDDTKSRKLLILSLENMKEYDDTVFELLKLYSNKINDSYCYYLLGLKYLDRNNYTQALKAFSNSKKLDNKDGYSYYSYDKTLYYRGTMIGLEKSIKQTLKKFPTNQNVENLKILYKTIKDNDFLFYETINLNLEGASSLIELNFKVRPIKDFNNHQKVRLLTTELSSKGKKLTVTPTENDDGALTINVPKSMWSRDIKLIFKYQIHLSALLNSYYDDGTMPEIENLKRDDNFSLNDPRLTKLVDYIDSLNLEDSEGIDYPDELFAIKASTVVAKGLKYQINNVDNNVSWALDNSNNCDCTEFSRLFTALCLTKGIPARQVSGFLIKSDNISDETTLGHAWSEVYIHGKGWTYFDPTSQISFHRAYSRNLLNNQIFFEYPLDFKDSRIGVNYSTSSSNIKISINNSYKISNW